MSLPLTLFLVAVGVTAVYVFYQVFFDAPRPTTRAINEEIEFDSRTAQREQPAYAPNGYAQNGYAQDDYKKMNGGGNNHTRMQHEPTKMPYNPQAPNEPHEDRF